MLKMIKEILSNNLILVKEIFKYDFGFGEVIAFILGYYHTRFKNNVVKILNKGGRL